MSWLSALRALLSIANALAGYMANRQLMQAGEARAVSEGLRKAHDAIARAQAARRAVNDDPDSVRDDEFNRDP